MDNGGLKTKVREYIKGKQLIRPGEHIIAGVSGGADSVCLVLLLDELKQELEITLEAVHVEHGIRGEESTADAVFVRELCEKLQIPCRIYPVRAKEYARKQKYTVEEAARYLRYGILQQRAAECRAARIAVAHNREDQAETILFHLLRGSSLAGLAGMKPKQGGIIRPLLSVSRQEIESYLAGRKQIFCTDSTNQDLDYTRNRLRRQIFPLLREINAQSVEHICRLGEEAAQTEEYFGKQAREALEDCLCKPELDSFAGGTDWQDAGVKCLELAKMQAYPVIIRNKMIYLALSGCAGSAKDITAEHVGQVAALAEKQTGRKVSLPYHMFAMRQYGKLLIYRQPLEPPSGYCRELDIPGSILLEDGRMLRTEIFDFDGKLQKIPKNHFTKWYDYDTINGSLQLRNRKAGDYVTIEKSGKTKKLKKYFVDEKVPQQMRDSIPLIAAGQHILWIIGYRGSQFAEVTADTKRVLEIRVIGGMGNE